MILEIHERLLALELLPKEGDYAALKTIRRAREMIALSPDEEKKLEIKRVTMPNGEVQLQWNTARAQEQVKDVPVDEYTTHVIRNALAEMSNAGKLKNDHISLYEKFVVTYK